MGEYSSSFIVFTLLIAAILIVGYLYFINNSNVKESSTVSSNEAIDYKDSYEEELKRIDQETASIIDNIFNDEIDEELYNEINEEENEITNDEINNETNDKTDDEEDIFDTDFSRDNKKTEPDITYYNALKLGRWEGDDYINDELGIKIKLLPGWALHDFNSSFHINEGSGQVNSAVFTLFSGSMDKYYETNKATNSNIFNFVTESNETIAGSNYRVLKCKYENKDYFERKVYITNTKIENIHICIETDFYNTDAPFATRNYELTDIFEKF